MDDKKKQVPEDGPNGVDRWSSNGYGLSIDGNKVISPEEKEDENGNKTSKDAAHER